MFPYANPVNLLRFREFLGDLHTTSSEVNCGQQGKTGNGARYGLSFSRSLNHLLRALLYSLLTAAVALPLGYFVEPWMGWVLFYIGLSVHLGFHYRNFSRLQRWSRKPFLDASLEGAG